MTVGQGLLLVAAGVLAGFVNTVAGGGSAVTLPILTDLLGPNAANGTNRIAILMANATATGRFSGGRAMPWRHVAPLVVPTLAGALAGAWTATLLSPAAMRRVFAVVLVLIAVSVAARPSIWLEGHEHRLAEPWRSLVFLAIGFYGGFVQAGVGFLLLAGLVLGGGLDLVRGNAAKVLLILLYTPLALFLFARADQVELAAGVILGVGNSTGALAASHLALRRGAAWIRWVLVVVAVGAAVRMLVG
ncbi:MAG TPA: sulfite exporter TauE/SafE family protein [Actinobacteria bacterium]|nr:sulfite exporter TauE/SafE family protein [Actinomycetota bacterium]